MEEPLGIRASDVVWHELDGEVIVLDSAAQTYLSTNPSGAVLWETLAKGATKSQLIDLLVDRFSLDRDRAGADVETFLDELRAQRLLAD